MHYTWLRGANYQLSRSFNSYEFECPCGQCVEQRISVALVDSLQKVRDDIQDVLVINSAYRCEGYQAELERRGYKTAKNSQHLLGNAADISSRSFEPLRRSVWKYFMAIGVASNFFHVDERRDKMRTWNY